MMKAKDTPSHCWHEANANCDAIQERVTVGRAKTQAGTGLPTSGFLNLPDGTNLLEPRVTMRIAGS
jgi:hypothetical protein